MNQVMLTYHGKLPGVPSHQDFNLVGFNLNNQLFKYQLSVSKLIMHTQQFRIWLISFSKLAPTAICCNYIIVKIKQSEFFH